MIWLLRGPLGPLFVSTAACTAGRPPITLVLGRLALPTANSLLVIVFAALLGTAIHPTGRQCRPCKTFL